MHFYERKALYTAGREWLIVCVLDVNLKFGERELSGWTNYEEFCVMIIHSTVNPGFSKHVPSIPTWALCRSRLILHNFALRWRHNELDGVSDHQPHICLLNRLFGRRSKKTSKLRVTGLCAGNSPGTGEFPAQMASNAENVSIWWRHHGLSKSIINSFWVFLLGNTKKAQLITMTS